MVWNTFRRSDARVGGPCFCSTETTSVSASLTYPSATSEEDGTTTSQEDGTGPDLDRLFPGLNARFAPVPAGPLQVTTRSATDWRQRYPRMGQFAMTPSEEVVAAFPEGLVYFMRVQDHPSKPWSKPKPLPSTSATLNASTVTGLSLCVDKKGGLHAFCVADAVLHSFTRIELTGHTFVVDPIPPFQGFSVSGTPVVSAITGRYDNQHYHDNQDYCAFAACPSGGLLYSFTHPCAGLSHFARWSEVHEVRGLEWEQAKGFVTHMGIISALSVVVMSYIPAHIDYKGDPVYVNIVAVVIVGDQLHAIRAQFSGSGEQSCFTQRWSYDGMKEDTRIQHPGEVTGNPVLLGSRTSDAVQGNDKLDLLVPSAEGGIFHFIQTPMTHGEWHMIGCVEFPLGIPLVSSLAFARLGDSPLVEFRAHVQCGGRLYLIKTTEGASPWTGSVLHPITAPGPFLH